MIYGIFIAIYVIGILAFAMYSSRSESRADFMIGNRQYGALPISIGIATSWLSSGFILYTYYISAFDFYTLVFLTLGCSSGVFIVSCMLKNFYERAVEKHYITMTEYVRGDIGPKMGLMAGLLNPLIFFFWFTFELVASGQLLAELSPMNYMQSILVLALTVGVYLALGGFKILMNSDLIQSFVLILFIGLAAVFLYNATGTEVTELKAHIVSMPLTLKGGIAAFFGFFGAFYWADLWQRVLCAKSYGSAKRGLRLAAVFYLIVYGSLGVLFALLVLKHPELKESGGFAYLVYDYSVPIIGALILTALVAAMMSTLDTIVFIAAQGFSTDLAFLRGFRLNNPKAALRISILIFMGLGLGIAYFIRDIEMLFWFMLSLIPALTPSAYLFLSKFKPSDNACATSAAIILANIVILQLSGVYEDYMIALNFTLGWVLPPVFDRLFFVRAK